LQEKRKKTKKKDQEKKKKVNKQGWGQMGFVQHNFFLLTCSPFGEKAMLVVPPPAPGPWLNNRTQFPVRMSHRRTVRSNDPVATIVALG
jgi:hypothetical protein